MSLWGRIYAERRQIVLPVLGFLVANIAVLVLAVLPLMHSVSDNQTAATDAHTKLLVAQQQNRNAKDARSRRDQAQQELAKFYAQVLPRDHNAAVQLLSFQVRAAAAQSGLKWMDDQTSPADVRESQLVQLSFHVTLVGSYQSLRKFLYALETAQEFVVLQKISLSDKNTDASSANQLLVDLDMATYYRGQQ